MMEKKEYIEKSNAISLIAKETACGTADKVKERVNGALYRESQWIGGIRDSILVLEDMDSSDVVPWSWLEQYATGKRCNFASEFVSEARKEWKSGTDDSNRND